MKKFRVFAMLVSLSVLAGCNKTDADKKAKVDKDRIQADADAAKAKADAKAKKADAVSDERFSSAEKPAPTRPTLEEAPPSPPAIRYEFEPSPKLEVPGLEIGEPKILTPSNPKLVEPTPDELESPKFSVPK